MTYVVTDNCIQCKYTDCVQVCPTDAFHEGPNFLVIKPEACIDCNLCVPVCPARAIFMEYDLPDDKRHFKALNECLARSWPRLAVKKPALPDADYWNGKRNKIDLLQLD